MSSNNNTNPETKKATSREQFSTNPERINAFPCELHSTNPEGKKQVASRSTPEQVGEKRHLDRTKIILIEGQS